MTKKDLSLEVTKLAVQAKSSLEPNTGIVLYALAAAMENDLYAYELALICQKFCKEKIRAEQNKGLN